jgi:hypothetical protein
MVYLYNCTQSKHDLDVERKIVLHWIVCCEWCLKSTFLHFGWIIYALYTNNDWLIDWLIDWFLVSNATFSYISAILWRPVLMVEEAGVPGENHDHGQATGKLYHLRMRVECTLFCNLQSRNRTHAVLVIGLYELLGY